MNEDTEIPSKFAVAPWVVAFLRGLAEAAVLAVIGAAIVALSEVSAGQLAPVAPIGVLVLRQLEGVADQLIDQTKQRLTGGAPAGHDT
jgi:hypothetical protein